ncbi:hypothetical protein [Streptomyces canus]|uniref:hypothetical protein n=1 Tax=Streptomyces canus TaxID=58343 RepID=UPI00371181C6
MSRSPTPAVSSLLPYDRQVPLDDGGRGLLLVEALADRWEVLDREPPPGKAVRAEVDVPGWSALAARAGSDG